MKKTIYNKIRCAAVATLGVLALSSCNDFLTITPTDKTVLEDYWKSKDDVDQMVNGAYKYLTAGGIIERFIVWGEFRSDEVVKYPGRTSTDLDNIAAVNLLPSIGYNSWADFYKVINTCNLVLEHAPAVMEIDPKFTEGDFKTVRAQMLALRSLCYFYLVRTFRDVPYTTEAFENTDQVLRGPQYSPSVVLQHCIDDLLEAEKSIYRYGTFGTSDWRNYGLFTRDAVDALLADIYLWRGSMTHNASDYQLCVDYADKVIQSRNNFYNANNTSLSAGSSSSTNIYHLYSGSVAMENIFQNGNSRESIFEIQFDGSSNSNEKLASYYYQAEEKKSDPGIFSGSKIMGSIEDNASPIAENSMFSTKNDYRYWNSCYKVDNADETNFKVRKMVENIESTISPEDDKTKLSEKTSRSFTNVKQNWIVYRLTDVMLMKAEALTQLAGENELQLRQAFNIVKVVNDRSLYLVSDAEQVKKDSLKFGDFSTQEKMEKLCLQERGRELCFEGKRWYDMIRYCYRHMTGVDATRMLYEIDPAGGRDSYPKLDSYFITLMGRKYSTGGDAVKVKMLNEAYLYWPVQQREIKANPDIHQNPVYIETKSTER